MERLLFLILLFEGLVWVLLTVLMIMAIIEAWPIDILATSKLWWDITKQVTSDTAMFIEKMKDA